MTIIGEVSQGTSLPYSAFLNKFPSPNHSNIEILCFSHFEHLGVFRHHDIDTPWYWCFPSMGVGMDHLSNMVFAPCGYSRAVFSAYIEFMAHLLVLYSLEDSTNNSDLRSKT